jgi:predicted ATPase
MIKKIKIENFKAHRKTELEFSNLNILTGINGVGKSSVFQSILLLRQSFENNNVLKEGLKLNKPHCDIGFISDAIYQYGDSDIISFSLDSDEVGEQIWQFKQTDNNSTKNFIPVHGEAPQVDKNLSVFNENFQYLSAARLSPRETYPLDSNAVESKKQLSIEKGQGELTVHFLYHYGIEKKQKIKFANLKNAKSTLDDLLSQTSAWEREISPGVNVVPELSGKSFSLKYNFEKPNDFATTNNFGAENVGFGLSYALPIIVSVLSADVGALLLIENPEAHLHPRGQSKIAELIALAAHNGIQVIIETHSDHIINGILVACKRYETDNERGIDREKVRIYHFSRDEDTHSAKCERIEIGQGGKIQNQPDDFFDQTDKDLQFLLGF